MIRLKSLDSSSVWRSTSCTPSTAIETIDRRPWASAPASLLSILVTIVDASILNCPPGFSAASRVTKAGRRAVTQHGQPVDHAPVAVQHAVGQYQENLIMLP